MRLASLGLCVAAACGRLDFDFGDTPHDAANRDAAAMTADAGGGCPSFAIFCDGFESGDVSKWTGVDNATTQLVTTGARYTGSFGLDSSYPMAMGNGGEGDVYVATDTASATMLAVREWVYAPTQLINYVGTLIVTQGVPATAPRYAEVVANDVGAWSLAEFGSDSGLNDHDGTIAAATATWTCVELVISFGPAPSAALYIDGSASVQADLLDTSAAYDHAAVGVTRTNAAGLEVYIDDVVVAAQRIGC